MTKIRPGMSVHLVKMANYDAELKRNGIGLGDIGTVMDASEPLGDDEPLWKVRFTRHGLDKVFWLGRENIEPTSPHGVVIEAPEANAPEFHGHWWSGRARTIGGVVMDQPIVREAGFYWVKGYGGWHPAEWDVAFGCRWWILGCELPYNDDEFDEIGPRIEPPEGLK